MASDLTARIIEWDRAKGYGYLQNGGGRLFLHRRDFADWYKNPEKGDVIRFAVGTDSRGRRCAIGAVHVNDGGEFTTVDMVVLLALLGLPVLAVWHLQVAPVEIGGYALAICLTAWAFYARDKRSARAKAWRVPEARLHLIELLGGWPGAFVAQRRLRHKCAKRSFQAIFWMIVFLYQFASIEVLQDWKISRAAVKQFESIVKEFRS